MYVTLTVHMADLLYLPYMPMIYTVIVYVAYFAMSYYCSYMFPVTNPPLSFLPTAAAGPRSRVTHA